MSPDTSKTTAAILCGGRSSRMGRSKAWLKWPSAGDGSTLLEHLVAVMTAATDEVVVVAAANAHLPEVEAHIVCDRDPHLGPLAGLREALEAAHGELLFVCAVDQPFLTPKDVRFALGVGRAAARTEGEVIHPLGAVYPRARLARAIALLDDGERRPRALLEADTGFASLAPEDWPGGPAAHDDLDEPDAYLSAIGPTGIVRVDGPGGIVVEAPPDSVQSLIDREVTWRDRSDLRGILAHGEEVARHAPLGPGDQLTLR